MARGLPQQLAGVRVIGRQGALALQIADIEHAVGDRRTAVGSTERSNRTISTWLSVTTITHVFRIPARAMARRAIMV
jgi:hypothetical protein